MRKEFSPQDKIKLAQRSGYVCSYPSCESITVGPSEEGAVKTSSVGMACHIFAASEGLNAKRTNLNLTPEQVTDISNGIWMCYTHGKLIDTDDVRYTPEMLHEWKRINENVAHVRQETGLDYKSARECIKLSSLVENGIDLPKTQNVNKLVGDAIHDSCLFIAWGEEMSDAIRDFLIEYVRNCFLHGAATKARLEINSKDLIVIDDGEDFDPRKMCGINATTGGVKSIKKLLEKYGSDVFLSNSRNNNQNYLKISGAKIYDHLVTATPCKVEIDFDQLHFGDVSYNLLDSCKELFVFLPDYFAHSDIALFGRKHPKFKQEKRHLIFIVRRMSVGVQSSLKEQFPESQIILVQ